MKRLLRSTALPTECAAVLLCSVLLLATPAACQVIAGVTPSKPFAATATTTAAPKTAATTAAPKKTTASPAAEGQGTAVPGYAFEAGRQEAVSSVAAALAQLLAQQQVRHCRYCLAPGH